MNISIYAICKNESRFVDRFLSSVIDADNITICDTGSTDDTVKQIEAWRERYPDKIALHSISISPWRFDFARNVSLGLVPKETDICVCLDLDEVLTEGWRPALEACWTPETTRLRYRYVWSWAADGVPGIVQRSDKIHARTNYIWKHPCHEVLRNYGGAETQTTAPDHSFAVHHHPDHTKPRAQYLDLLEMGAKEDPGCDRSAYYLAREYFFYGRDEDAVREFERHRSLPSLWWDAERAASHRYQAKALTRLGRLSEARDNFEQGCKFDPLHRGGWNDLALANYQLEDWDACYAAATQALRIDRDHGTYIMDQKEAFGPLAHDLASISAWRLGLYEEAEKHCRQAIALAPTDDRLLANLAAIQASSNSTL